jgi:hypothetical protein
LSSIKYFMILAYVLFEGRVDYEVWFLEGG